MALTSSRALSAPNVKSLPNGLRTVVIEDHASPVVSLQIWVRCGGVNEAGPTSGVSHFLEHMIFKGTDKISANEISKIVESNGGSINAATGGETTHYYIDMPSNKWEQAFDVLSQSVLRPAFPPAEFEKERKSFWKKSNAATTTLNRICGTDFWKPFTPRLPIASV
jgi:zinc protease